MIGKEYDNSNNVTQLCQFKELVSLSATYAALSATLLERKPNLKTDSITKITYDALGFEEEPVPMR